MSKSPKDRPPAKDKIVTFRVPPADFEAGQAKAQARGSTVSKIMRALFWMWAHGEGVPADQDWPPELEDQEVRAAMRPKQKRKK